MVITFHARMLTGGAINQIPPTPPVRLKVETLRRNELQFALTCDTLSRLSFSTDNSLF